MASWTIYYNPKCGTCRKALELLKSKKIEPRVVKYLKTPPSADEIESILKKLNMEPREMVRSKEPIYEELKLGTVKKSRAEWLKIIHENPILIQRPIVVKDNLAVIARPPEELLKLL
jgi:arsenate reductase